MPATCGAAAGDKKAIDGRVPDGRLVVLWAEFQRPVLKIARRSKLFISLMISVRATGIGSPVDGARGDWWCCLPPVANGERTSIERVRGADMRPLSIATAR